MTYYKVKPEYDNKTRYKYDNHHNGVPDSFLIANELYTPTEFQKIANCPAWFDTIEVPKNKTYFFFGARFAM